MPDADTAVSTSSEAEATEGSQTPEATDPATVIASYKKRQAGAEAARQAAEKKAADLQARLEALEAKNRTSEDEETATIAKLQEQLRTANEKAASADAAIAAAKLDAKYPNARAELPEVTDEVRLAKFEAMLQEDGVETLTPPKPIGNNPSRNTGGATEAPNPAETTIAAGWQQIRKMAPDWLRGENS